MVKKDRTANSAPPPWAPLLNEHFLMHDYIYKINKIYNIYKLYEIIYNYKNKKFKYPIKNEQTL